jgi:hypothetical protein
MLLIPTTLLSTGLITITCEELKLVLKDAARIVVVERASIVLIALGNQISGCYWNSKAKSNCFAEHLLAYKNYFLVNSCSNNDFSKELIN